jgi:ribonuclease HI
VDLATGKELFRESVGNMTADIGGFLGLVEAVKYILESGFNPKVIYMDSLAALAWFREKQAASKKKPPRALKAGIFLKAFAAEIAGIEVLHWDNRRWGENPADFREK